MTPREREQADALATREVPCPRCGLAVLWPENVSALEANCHDCGCVLRLEPCGCVTATDPEPRPEPATNGHDPEDLEAL